MSKAFRIPWSAAITMLVAVALVGGACSDDGDAGDCGEFLAELADIESSLDEVPSEEWEEIAELQGAIQRRNALLAAIASGDC